MLQPASSELILSIISIFLHWLDQVPLSLRILLHFLKSARCQLHELRPLIGLLSIDSFGCGVVCSLEDEALRRVLSEEGMLVLPSSVRSKFRRALTVRADRLVVFGICSLLD